MKARLFERDHFVETRYELKYESLPNAFDGLKMVFLSDLHGKSFGAGNGELTAAMRSFGPDLILIGGDSMTVKPYRTQDFSSLEDILKEFSGRVPIFCGEGNHETRMRRKPEKYPLWHQAYEELLSRYGVTELRDQAHVLTRGAHEIAVAGISLEEEQYLHGKKRSVHPDFLEKKLAHPERFTVLMLHSPAYLEEAAEWGADLTLAGHYHGGTIYIPKLGGLMTPQFVFFEKRVRGVFEYGERKGVVSAGLGTHSVNLRVNDPPELVELILRSGERT